MVFVRPRVHFCVATSDLASGAHVPWKLARYSRIKPQQTWGCVFTSNRIFWDIRPVVDLMKKTRV